MADTPTIYVVVDMKTVPDGDGYAVVIDKTQHRTRAKAEARYHSALASAANTEQYMCWSAVLITNTGFVIASEHYEHEVQPEPEPETEGE